MRVRNTNLQGDTAGHALRQGNIYPLLYTAEEPARRMGMVRKEAVLRAAQRQDVSITQILFSFNELFTAC